jgi:hypothetical protein
VVKLNLRGFVIVNNIWVAIIMGIAFLAGIGSWIKTRMIIKDLAEIKARLGIKEERTPSVFDNELDKD